MNDVTRLALSPDERVIWSSPLRGTPGGTNWRRTALITLWLIVALPGAGFVVGFVEAAVKRGFGPYALLLHVLIAGALLVRILRATRRETVEDALFVTNERIIEHSRFGKRSIPLAQVRSAKRVVIEMRRTRIPTDSVELKGPPPGFFGVLIGPTLDADRLCELLRLIARGELDPLHLPTIAGKRTPIEERERALIARAHRIDDMVMGPLFIGPTRVLRAVERLPLAIEADLYRAIASTKNAAKAEKAVREVLSGPDAGFVHDLDRAEANPHFDGDTLVILRAGREERIALPDPDREHFRRAFERRAAADAEPAEPASAHA